MIKMKTGAEQIGNAGKDIDNGKGFVIYNSLSFCIKNSKT